MEFGFCSWGFWGGHISVLLTQLNVFLVALLSYFFYFFADLLAHFAVWFFIFNWAAFPWRICLLESSQRRSRQNVTPLSDFSSLPQRNLCRWPRFIIIIIFNDSPEKRRRSDGADWSAALSHRLWSCAICLFHHKGRELAICVRARCKHEAAARRIIIQWWNLTRAQ